MIKPLFLYHSSLNDTCFAVPNDRFVYGLERKFSYQKFESKSHEPKGRGKWKNLTLIENSGYFTYQQF